MRRPNGGNRWDIRAARRFVRFYDRWEIRYLLAPILITGLPLLVLQFYGNPSYAKWVSELSKPVAVFLSVSSGLVIFTFSIYPNFLLWFGRAIRARMERNNVGAEELLALNSALDSVVGLKSRVLSEALSNSNSHQGFFDPQRQIAEILLSICNFFNAIAPVGSSRSLIRVSLAVVEDGKIIGLPVFYPNDEPIRSSIDDLNHPNSGFQAALRTQRIVVVNSVQKELKKGPLARRFHDTGVQADNVGSLICYPVVLKFSKGVPYVIAIHVDEENYFKNEKAALYDLYLGRFALRLELEYSVLNLKERKP